MRAWGDTERWRGQTVIVADDVTPVRDTLTYALQRRLPGLLVLEAANGDEIEALVEEHDVACVVTDWHLGTPDGLRVIMRMQERGHPAARVLITAYTDLPLDPFGLGLVGVDAVLRKPFQLTRLVTLVRVLLQRPPERRQRFRLNGAHFVEYAAENHIPRTARLDAPALRHCKNAHPNPPHVKFCGECGARLGLITEAPAGRRYDGDVAGAYLESLSDEPPLAALFNAALTAPRRAPPDDAASPPGEEAPG